MVLMYMKTFLQAISEESHQTDTHVRCTRPITEGDNEQSHICSHNCTHKQISFTDVPLDLQLTSVTNWYDHRKHVYKHCEWIQSQMVCVLLKTACLAQYCSSIKTLKYTEYLNINTVQYEILSIRLKVVYHHVIDTYCKLVGCGSKKLNLARSYGMFGGSKHKFLFRYHQLMSCYIFNSYCNTHNPKLQTTLTDTQSNTDWTKYIILLLHIFHIYWY